jgi:hypothetical protein
MEMKTYRYECGGCQTSRLTLETTEEFEADKFFPTCVCRSIVPMFLLKDGVEWQ